MTPAPMSEGEPQGPFTFSESGFIYDKDGKLVCYCGLDDAKGEFVLAALNALRAPRKEPGAVPVAWRWRWASSHEDWRLFSAHSSEAGRADFIRDQEKIAPIVVEPLYTSPNGGREARDMAGPWSHHPANPNIGPTSPPVSFERVQAGYDAWAAKPHNAKWVRRLDGTPIPGDLVVCIFDALRAQPHVEEKPE